MNELSGKWEKRWHPLKRQWIVYAAHRNSRPWSGHTLQDAVTNNVDYDPHCYLCPGNRRVSGRVNPNYSGVFVFDNDHPVVSPDAPNVYENENDIYIRHTAKGVARVLCYHPSHIVSLSEMTSKEVAQVFKVMKAQTQEFEQKKDIVSILIFENKGKAVGVSNPHPHCQIYATDFFLHHVDQERRAVADFKDQTGKNLFEEIISAEISDGRRIVVNRDQSLAFVPFFARYAFEVMIFPRRRVPTLLHLENDELEDLAKAFHEVIQRYDGLFEMSFPYVMSINQAPIDQKRYADYHMYIHIQPPLRKPGLIKHLGGPEIGAGNFMADTIPEEKAQELRNVQLGDQGQRN